MPGDFPYKCVTLGKLLNIFNPLSPPVKLEY